MKCYIKKKGDKDTDRIIKRRFISIGFTVEQEGQCISSQVKLPFDTTKTTAVLVTSTVENPCSDRPIPSRYYYGISTHKMTDTGFLKDNQGISYNQSYPPDGFSNGSFDNQWWYYVHPVSDRYPILIENGYFQQLTNPITLEFTQQGQCSADSYYLWSGKLPKQGFVMVTFFQPS